MDPRMGQRRHFLMKGTARPILRDIGKERENHIGRTAHGLTLDMDRRTTTPLVNIKNKRGSNFVVKI